jgi:hypothetical protein
MAQRAGWRTGMASMGNGAVEVVDVTGSLDGECISAAVGALLYAGPTSRLSWWHR